MISRGIVWLYLFTTSRLLSVAMDQNTSNDTTMDCTANSWTSLSWCSIFDSILVVLMFILFISLEINYVQLKALKQFVQIIKVELMALFIRNTTAKQRTRQTELADFIPHKPYKVYEINDTTSIQVFEMLIIEASKTNRFSCIHENIPHSDHLRLTIEFIQENSSIVVNLVLRCDATELRMKTDRLLASIFQQSNTVYTWGIDYYNQFDFTGFDLYYEPRHTVALIVNIQKQFKQWYNRTFPHCDDCKQVLDFIDLDGPLCSCPHRPYKHPRDQWSLQLAIMFTFYEYLDASDRLIFQCLAITKLLSVIEEERNRDYIEGFSRVPSIGRKVKSSCNDQH